MDPGQPLPPTPRQQAALFQAGQRAWQRFLLVFLLGGAIIWMLKGFLEQPVLAAAGAALIVLFYAVTVAQQPAVGRGTDVVDSIYYLGFLFTLVSLSIGLLQAGTGGAAAVAGDFGIAIMSTIAGMLGRICLTIRRDGSAEGMDDQVRASLHEAGEKLQAEIRYAVADFGEFRDGLRKQYDDHVKSVAGFAAAMENAVRTSQERAADLQKLAALGMTLPKDLEATIQDFLKQLQRTATSVNERAALIERTGEQLEVFVASAQSVGGVWRTAADQLGKETASAAQALQAAVVRIESVDFAGEIRRQFQAAGIFEAVSNPKVEGMEDLRNAAQSISHALDAVRHSNAELVEHVRGAVTTFGAGYAPPPPGAYGPSGPGSGGPRLADEHAAGSFPASASAAVPTRTGAGTPVWSLVFWSGLVTVCVCLALYLLGLNLGWWADEPLAPPPPVPAVTAPFPPVPDPADIVGPLAPPPAEPDPELPVESGL